MNSVGHPTARLHLFVVALYKLLSQYLFCIFLYYYLIGIKSPEFEFLFEQGPTNVGRIMKFTSSVIVEYLGKDAWMSVEKELVENGIVVGKGFRQPWKSCGRDFLQRRSVSFKTESTNVENNSILTIHGVLISIILVMVGGGGWSSKIDEDAIHPVAAK